MPFCRKLCNLPFVALTSGGDRHTLGNELEPPFSQEARGSWVHRSLAHSKLLNGAMVRRTSPQPAQMLLHALPPVL